MNKKLLYCILIICTLITSATVVYILSCDSINNSQVEETVEVKNETPKETKKEDLKQSADAEIKKQSEKKNEADKTVKEAKNNKPTKGTKAQENSQKDIASTTKKEEAKSVFKVSAGNIEKSLSTMDKAKLLFIGSKLSTVDEGRVKDYLSNKDQEEGVKKAYKLLKQRLDDDDINKVKEILEKYINIDVVENQ